MAAENTMTAKVDEYRIELQLLNNEVDTGTDITLKGKLSCSPIADLSGTTLQIEDQDGALVESIELTEFDGETNETGECIVKTPHQPGAYTWLAVCPAHESAGISFEEVSTSFSFTVKPHSMRVVVWDTPLTIECGKQFSIKFGVKCSSECRPDAWVLAVSDHDGNELARTTLSDDPWPDTAALYHAEVELTAHDTVGLYAWEARARAPGLDAPHTECVARFNVTVVPTPECVLRVEAIDMESQTPVKGARVVVHPYRAVTDECGVAEVSVPKGAYRLFVSGGSYFPFRTDCEVKTDITLRAELRLDLAPSEADVWS